MSTDRKTVRVVPAVGRVVPDPERGDTLPSEGRDVVRSPYWARRIKEQDVTEHEVPAVTETATEGDSQAGMAATTTKTAKGAK